MLFNSLDFFIFAIIFFALWPFLRKRDNVRWLYITAASFIFYGWWDWRFLFLITGSGFFNYFLGLLIERRRHPVLLWIAVIGNLSVLGIFKYADFTVHNFNWFLNMFGYGHQIPLPELILPVGISFYTFQAMSYTLDIYSGKLTSARNLLHLMAFLSCFPQLVAGPIVRASDFLPQLETPGCASREDRWEGVQLIIWGYLKKCLIADNLAPMVNTIFQNSTEYSGLLCWWGAMLGFAFQIYGDFSGYSDIAGGLARWMGYHFPINFNQPYTARSFRDFWGRWHISLSTWFRDYVYIPLGGNRCSRMRSNFNMFLTMVISGFWHGASWNFVIWGALHGVFLWCERLLHLQERLSEIVIGRIIGAAITFFCVVIAWVFFRATSFVQAFEILGNLFDNELGPGISLAAYGKALLIEILMLAVVVYLWCEPNRFRLFRLQFWERTKVPGLIFLACVTIFFRGVGGAFIYFQF